MIKSYIKRKSYLNKITPYINKDIIKVLVGQRRVGKSFMLYQIMDLLLEQGVKKDRIIYINMELQEFEFIKNSWDLLNYIGEKAPGRRKTYVFVDEIQEISNFEKALTDLLARGNFDLYCTGSNARLLSGELATYLGGRYIEIKIFGLTYLEFLQFHKLENNQDSLNKYIKYGGLPYLKNLKLEDFIIYDYLKNIFNTILLKDVVRRYKIRNVAFLERLVEYAADNIGSIVSAKKISDFLKSQKINISPNIVLDYLSYLCSAFFIFKVPRSEISGKKIFEIGEKYYFEDLGLRHCITNYKSIDINKVLENLVFFHLNVLGYKIMVGKQENREVDFVCENTGGRLYVQTAYLIPDQKVREREFGNLLAIKDNYPKIVVSMDQSAGGTYKGIKHLHIIDLLTNFK